jgi:hypothetical protein
MPRVRKNWTIDDKGYIRGKLDQILGHIEQRDGHWEVTIKTQSPRRNRSFDTRPEAVAYVAGLEAATQ